MKDKKLVYGVGINDADYIVHKTKEINGKWKIIWRCPFYAKWSNMLERCYSEKLHSKHPSYSGCYAVAEWHSFMGFRGWMVAQDWENKELDKDLLVSGNKLYSPETCVFVSQAVNSFLTDSMAKRGNLPIGVSFHKNRGKYVAYCRDVVAGRQIHLGTFNNPDDAHQAWLSCKLSQAFILASQQTDPRVAAALIDRYENYK